MCLATLGPGATNLVTAAAYAQLGAMPMLMITGQNPIRNSKQGQFQIVDVVDMMEPLTKYTHQISSAHNIPAKIREAFRRTEDIADEETEAPIIRKSRFSIPHASDDSIAQAQAMIEGARHPLLLIGAGANRKHTCGVDCFCRQNRHPLFLHANGQGGCR